MLRILLCLSLVLLTASCSTIPPEMPVPSEVLLTWSDNSDDEDCFVIERKQLGGDYVLLAVVDKDCKAYVDRLIDEGQAYAYRIRAQNEYGCSNPVESRVVWVSPPKAPPREIDSCVARPSADAACGKCSR